MSQFKRILFPVNGNTHAIEYALDMAQRSHAKIFLLKTYRLLEEMSKHKAGDKSLKLSIDELIEQEFNEKYRPILDKWDVDYELLVEVGFLTDRIISNISEKKIDMLLLDGLNTNTDEMLLERFPELKVPVLLIPEPNPNVEPAS